MRKMRLHRRRDATAAVGRLHMQEMGGRKERMPDPSLHRLLDGEQHVFARRYAELAIDVMDMGPCGIGRNEQHLGYIGAAVPVGEQREYLALPLRKAVPFDKKSACGCARRPRQPFLAGVARANRASLLPDRLAPACAWRILLDAWNASDDEPPCAASAAPRSKRAKTERRAGASIAFFELFSAKRAFRGSEGSVPEDACERVAPLPSGEPNTETPLPRSPSERTDSTFPVSAPVLKSLIS